MARRGGRDWRTKVHRGDEPFVAGPVEEFTHHEYRIHCPKCGCKRLRCGWPVGRYTGVKRITCPECGYNGPAPAVPEAPNA